MDQGYRKWNVNEYKTICQLIHWGLTSRMKAKTESLPPFILNTPQNHGLAENLRVGTKLEGVF